MGKIAEQFNPMIEQARTQFNGLSPKDQKAVVAFSVFVIGVLFWLIAWQPSQEWITTERDSFRREQTTSEFIAANYQQVKELTQETNGAPKQDAASVISKTGKLAGLQLTRVQPANQGVSVWIDAAPYQILLGWLVDLSNDQGLNVQQFRLERTASPGVVKVFMRLAR